MGRSTVRRARAATSWLSLRTTTQLTLTGSKPQASAASMPAMVCSSQPRRVISSNSTGSSVSSEMLTRLSPASLSCDASLGSRAPLVVSEMSSICGIARMSRMSGMIRRLTSGSPPVRRTRRMPPPRHQAHKVGNFLGTEQLVVRAGCHAIGRHAVNAAEIALVGNGNAQVVDIAAKAVMLHVPVHAALPSRWSLFFREYSTAREE